MFGHSERVCQETLANVLPLSHSRSQPVVSEQLGVDIAGNKCPCTKHWFLPLRCWSWILPDFSQGTFRVSISKPSAIVQSPTPSPMRRQNFFPSASFFVASEAEWPHWMLLNRPDRPNRCISSLLSSSPRKDSCISRLRCTHMHSSTLSPASGKKAAVLLNLRGRGNDHFHWRSLP